MPAPVAIIVSRYNASITDRLLEGALAEFRERGGAESAVDVLPAPGAWELTAIAAAAARSGRYRAIVALGCLIKGETMHDRLIADAVAGGLTAVAVETGVAVGFGVLTVETAAQAEARAGGSEGNKGREAMAAALETAGVIEGIASGVSRPWRASGSSKPDKVRGSGSGASGRGSKG